jgi:hypothetical protein
MHFSHLPFFIYLYCVMQESSAYGLCISRNFDDIKHNVCGKEFDVLKRCFQRSRALQK